MQTHLGAYTRKCPGEKVCGTHPRLERPEGMLYGLPAHTHRFWLCIETCLHVIEYRFMLPAFNATLRALSALCLDRAMWTRRAPIDIECASALNTP